MIQIDPARTQPQAHDEHRDVTGAVRPHQRLLEEFLAAQSDEAVTGLQRAIRGRMSEQEVTFNILGVPQGNNRPWQLDPVPLVLDHTEYSALGAGLWVLYRIVRGWLRLVSEKGMPQ